MISLFVAVVFAIAAMPGSMAMPMKAKAADDCASMSQMHKSMAMPCCDHAVQKPAHKAPGTPCKNMAVCFGLLSCYGMAAVGFSMPEAFIPSRDALVAFSHQSVSGLTHQPDNPPPIV